MAADPVGGEFLTATHTHVGHETYFVSGGERNFGRNSCRRAFLTERCFARLHERVISARHFVLKRYVIFT